MAHEAPDESLFDVALYNGHPFTRSGYLDERSNPRAAYEGIDYDPLPIHREEYFKPPLWLRLWVIAMTFFTSPRLPRQYMRQATPSSTSLHPTSNCGEDSERHPHVCTRPNLASSPNSPQLKTLRSRLGGCRIRRCFRTSRRDCGPRRLAYEPPIYLCTTSRIVHLHQAGHLDLLMFRRIFSRRVASSRLLSLHSSIRTIYPTLHPLCG
jgi:hypothetical protein